MVPDTDSLSTSAGHIFQLFRHGSVRTRGELRQLTGLSRSTVLQRVAALLETGTELEVIVDLTVENEVDGTISLAIG